MAIQSYWASNLKFLRNRKKLSQDDLANTLSITRSKYNAHESGATKNPPLEDLLQFSNYFRLSIDSMLKIDLSKLSELKIRELEAGNDVYATGTHIRVLATTVNASNKDNIELVPVKAKAGYTSGYGDPDFISKLPVFNLPHLPKDRKYRMFPTTGDSMLPVPEGAFVIGEFVEDWKGIKANTPGIVITKNEGIVFKLIAVQDNKLRLTSLNSIYAPYDVSISEVVEVWQFRSLICDTLPEAEMTMAQLAHTLQELKADVKQLIKTK